MKKTVIAYLHTHWDREWYREFEIFRLRLVRVFDCVLDLLEKGKIPCFYFDGQTSALEDYLELNKDKEPLVKKMIAQKKLFIGPFYSLADEFLTDETCLKKNLDIGMKYAQSLGCKDFIGYFADTFGHSKNIPSILKDYGIDKMMVWRGCSPDIPSEFLYNGLNAVNMVRGYFMDIFSADIPIAQKASFLEDNLDKIAKISSDVLLLPIGADHLGVEADVLEQIKEVNKLLSNYEIKLSSPFEYFELVKNNFKYVHNEELRDNSTTFILPGCYSSRINLKQYNNKCSYMLDLANRFQKYATRKYKTKSYDSIIDYAYKLLLQNQAHDGICGCSTDLVHRENVIRYEKVLQIANTVIEELKLEIGKPLITNLSNDVFNGIIQFESSEKLSRKNYQQISKRIGVESSLFYDTQKIPVTEDFKPIYTYLTEVENKAPSKPLAKKGKISVGILSETDLFLTGKSIENSKIALRVINHKIEIHDKISDETYSNFLELIDFKDLGDTYNFGPLSDDIGKLAKIISSKIFKKGALRGELLIKLKLNGSILNLYVSLNKGSRLLNFRIEWNNKSKNHLLQVKFNLKESVKTTYSDDMGAIIERTFNSDYDIRKNLPKEKGVESKTNTAPMSKYLSTQGFELVTHGLNEYEVSKNSILLTILRATGIISNPKNPSRSTPAGPPIEVLDAQQLGANSVEFALGFGEINNWQKTVSEIYPYVIANL